MIYLGLWLNRVPDAFAYIRAILMAPSPSVSRGAHAHHIRALLTALSNLEMKKGERVQVNSKKKGDRVQVNSKLEMKKGDRVQVNLPNGRGTAVGRVECCRYMVSEKATKIGVRLDKPLGNSNGGDYFKCPPNFGVFVDQKDATLLPGAVAVSRVL